MEYAISNDSRKTMNSLNDTLNIMLKECNGADTLVQNLYILLADLFKADGDKVLQGTALFLAKTIVVAYFQRFDNDKKLEQGGESDA